jgi:hypothetical protein
MMKFAIAATLFVIATALSAQSPILLQAPNPSWVSGPISYWRCPKGWGVTYRTVSEQRELVTMPRCTQFGRRFAQLHPARDFDIDTQELIFWVWSKTIPASGVLRIDYPLKFASLPGCEILGHKKEPSQSLPEEAIDHLTIYGKPGITLSFSCLGIINRNP